MYPPSRSSVRQLVTRRRSQRRGGLCHEEQLRALGSSFYDRGGARPTLETRARRPLDHDTSTRPRGYPLRTRKTPVRTRWTWLSAFRARHQLCTLRRTALHSEIISLLARCARFAPSVPLGAPPPVGARGVVRHGRGSSSSRTARSQSPAGVSTWKQADTEPPSPLRPIASCMSFPSRSRSHPTRLHLTRVFVHL